MQGGAVLKHGFVEDGDVLGILEMGDIPQV
jgi:hypothetical protein